MLVNDAGADEGLPELLGGHPFELLDDLIEGEGDPV